MLYLEKDLFLKNLEKRASPYQVAQTLYCRWENEKSNLQYFLRAGIECWYWLDNDIFWNNYLKQDELKDFEEILTTYLCKVCVYGFENQSENPVFLCMFGYMIRLFPYFFINLTGDYDKDLETGNKMISKAYRLNPDPLTTLLITKEGTPEWEERYAIMKNAFSNLFHGEAIMDQYFRSVWGENF